MVLGGRGVERFNARRIAMDFEAGRWHGEAFVVSQADLGRIGHTRPLPRRRREASPLASRLTATGCRVLPAHEVRHMTTALRLRCRGAG